MADVVSRLAELTARRELLLARVRAAGVTWAELAATLGVSVQQAHKRYRTTRRDPTTDRKWRELPYRRDQHAEAGLPSPVAACPYARHVLGGRSPKFHDDNARPPVNRA